MYIEIDKNRKQIAGHSDYAGKNTKGAIKVDCAAPSEFHALKSDYKKFKGVKQWKISAAHKQEVIALLKKKIDAEADAKILNDFEFAGKKFHLSDRNKFEYKAEYDIREVLTYPHRIKCVDGYYDIASVEDHHAWYMAGLQFVRACTEAGWAKIDALQNKTTGQLIQELSDRKKNRNT